MSHNNKGLISVSDDLGALVLPSFYQISTRVPPLGNSLIKV